MTQITTLIPAYKKEYLGPLFLALRRQSFKDFKVIVSDDSPGGVITDMIRNRHWGQLTDELNITVVRGPQNARRNHEQLLDLWAGSTPLVHFNLDDDLIYPEFYRTHVAAHVAAPCCASVSQRWLSHDDGVPAWTLPLPDFVHECNGHVLQPTTEELFNSTVGTCQNWLGELSNMVFSAEGAALYPRPPAKDLSYYGLLDVGALLAASQHLPVTFIREYLGVFRQNEQQTTQVSTYSHGGRVGFLAWVTYALAAWRDGHINPETAIGAIGTATQRIVHHFSEDTVMAEYFHILDTQAGSLDQLYLAYRTFWLKLLASNPGTAAGLQEPAKAPTGASSQKNELADATI
ncbi:MAG: glycosyltransferase family 2 protein [Aquabacterium sp.]|uniref:glycosyltransferase family A protein n=1 Tax=Aquabacterium sp. TaxID=1872578 RepID=UPI00122A9796|nr:glycosyltransferase family A protein [Aquabacterium sp.]TAK98361.1 MAG: glycosyltransferase family 2 protein [Aquabacterium sp.]